MSEIKIAALKNVCPDRPLSAMTLARLEEITEHIAAHENNIAYLQFIAGCRKTLQRMGKKIIPALQITREGETRLPKTLNNLQQQIDLLNYEREVLKRYGR